MAVQTISLFPSPIHVIQIDKFSSIKKDLISWIYSYQNKNKNQQISGRNSWQSSTNFYKEEKSFFRYEKMINESISETLKLFFIRKYNITNMWININPSGGYNVSHTHPDSHLSGVFWVNTPKNCGVLKFESPNHFTQYKMIDSYHENIKQSLNLYHDFWLEPTEGRIIIFPSDIKHFVEINESSEDRISISFNISF